MKIQGLDVDVIDSTHPLEVTITAADIRNGKKKNAYACAAALAICREHGATQAIVHLSRAYVKKGNTWFRYRTPACVRSEVVAFDRGGNFAPGDYVFHGLPPSNMMGARDKRKPRGRKTTRKPTQRPLRPVHSVTGVRGRMEFDK